jgi:hypothetical protein
MEESGKRIVVFGGFQSTLLDGLRQNEVGGACGQLNRFRLRS